MGVSTGQIFQPKLMQVVEPQKRESTWEQVLPTILTSLASTAAKGYVENKIEQTKLEQERMAKGYIKNPDGTWSLPNHMKESFRVFILRYPNGRFKTRAAIVTMMVNVATL